MNKGNSKKVMAEAAEIVRRLVETKVGIKQLQAEYHCGYPVLKRAIGSQLTKARWRRIRKKKIAAGGIKSRFQKGHKTWNKGTHYGPGKGAEKTQYKKGHLPDRHKHMGTITIRNDKHNRQYRWIKVSGILDGKHQWLQYARYVWEKKNGPIPDGLFPIHTDGDTLNDSIGNLQLVDRKKSLMLMLGRDGNLKKCRKRAARAVRRRHAKTRRIKQKEAAVRAKLLEGYRISRQQELAEKKTIARQLTRQHGKAKVVWECIGCGTDYDNEPPGICPKCNGLRFSKIKINAEAVLSEY